MKETAVRAAPGSDLDPAIRTFIRTVSADFARYPDSSSLTPAQMREVAEKVRAPWTAGGPVMARTQELQVPFRGRHVRVRVHWPALGAPRAALVYLHGGGWTLFSIDTHDRLMREYAARSECIVVGVDYSLWPEAKFPTALEEVVQVVRWLRDHGQSLDIRSDRLALGGDSAGGNLTMAACSSLRDSGEADSIRAMLLNYAALDIECSPQSHALYGGPGYMLGSGEMTQFWRNYMRDARDADDPLVCPVLGRLQDLPPAFFTIAECDILAHQNGVMAERMRAAGVAVEAVVYRGASHSFLEAVSIAGISGRALDDASRWLRSTLA